MDLFDGKNLLIKFLIYDFRLTNCPTAAWRLLTANYQFGFEICDLKFEIFD